MLAFVLSVDFMFSLTFFIVSLVYDISKTEYNLSPALPDGQ
jgi:hypothetical protein